MEIVVQGRRSRWSPVRLVFVSAFGLITLGLAALAIPGFSWALLKPTLRARFPEVQWIAPHELASWLADDRRSPPLLLDVRTMEEWNVSHIPGARRVDPEVAAERATAGISKETSIVTYCAVGYRSGEMAKRLQAAGFTRVQNLEGSIFQWANDGRLLVRGNERVTRVHPYNSFWGSLLAREARATLK